jgi:hypothetical protein
MVGFGIYCIMRTGIVSIDPNGFIYCITNVEMSVNNRKLRYPNWRTLDERSTDNESKRVRQIIGCKSNRGEKVKS